jgi:hypothetical protein
MSFVIMLDHELAAHQDDWPITAERQTLDSIRSVTQFSGNPRLDPRPSRRMTRLEAKSMTNTQTGDVKPGAIYDAQ